MLKSSQVSKKWQMEIKSFITLTLIFLDLLSILVSAILSHYPKSQKKQLLIQKHFANSILRGSPKLLLFPILFLINFYQIQKITHKNHLFLSLLVLMECYVCLIIMRKLSFLHFKVLMMELPHLLSVRIIVI